MRRWRKGGVTIFVSLMMAVLLGFLQICLQSAQNALRRSQTEEALELAEASVLSEYHRELLERYDVFYLDLSYGSEVEDTEYLKHRMREYLNVNLPAGETMALEISEISRATDEKGLGFYEQAVSYVKQKTGVSVIEEMQQYKALGFQGAEEEAVYEAREAEERSNLEELKRRRRDEEELGTEDPTTELERVKNSSLLQLILEEPERISGKKAESGQMPSARQNLPGAGSRGIQKPNAGNDAFFHQYLKEHFTKATDFLAGDQEPGEWLDYQLEYVIAGKETDIENLESVCGRILALREGVNYAYLLTDGEKVAECEALAASLVGATLIPGLVEAMKQVLLLSWAFVESVMDLRRLLQEKRVTFWKSSDTWKTSLAEVLELGNGMEGAETDGDGQGLLYADYLMILLTLETRGNKTGRSLDVIEGSIRGRTGGNHFYLDQCADGFRMRTVILNGQEWTAWRWVCYEW